MERAEVNSLSTSTEGRSSNEGVARQHELKCSICRRAPIDPVLAASGQVYCLPCIYRWVLSCPPNPCPVCRHVYDAGACNATTVACAHSRGVADVPPSPNNSLLGASNARAWTDDRIRMRDMRMKLNTMEAEIQNLQRRNSLWEQVADKNEARDLEMVNELSRRLERANELSRSNARLQERLDRANELLPKSFRQ